MSQKQHFLTGLLDTGNYNDKYVSPDTAWMMWADITYQLAYKQTLFHGLNQSQKRVHHIKIIWCT